MSVPDIVDAALEGEEIATRVPLGNDDELFVTPSCTLLYRSDGLLSDESVEEYPHDANRLTVSEGRRKTRISLEYALDGTREFTVPTSKAEAVLHPVIAGILAGNGITEPGESVVQTYRFSELTVIVTSNRLVKHIGEAVWDTDFEQYRFEDVTNLSFEDGSVATQIVLAVDGRPQRIKAPNEHAGDLRERLERALFAYHDVDSLEELNGMTEDADGGESVDPARAFGDGLKPLDTGSSDGNEHTTDASSVGTEADMPDSGSQTLVTEGTTISDPSSGEGASNGRASETPRTGDGASESDARESGGDRPADRADDSFDGSGFEPATSVDAELLDRLDELEAQVEQQTDLLERQQALIETLIEELRAGR